MTMHPDQLKSMNYHLDKELDHNELIFFVRQNLGQPNPFTVFYWGFNLLLLILSVIFLFTENRLPVFDALTKMFQGFFLFFIILLPLHELIHGIFYKIAGARKIQFKAIWKKLVFYCIADGYVANTKSFLKIALAPFLVINAMLFTIMFFATPGLFYILLGAMVIHTGGCAGDFGLCAYFYRNRKNKPLTVDDASRNKTFFFLKNTEQPFP